MSSKEQAIYSSSGRRVKFDAALDDDDVNDEDIYYDHHDDKLHTPNSSHDVSYDSESIEVVMTEAPPPPKHAQPRKKRVPTDGIQSSRTTVRTIEPPVVTPVRVSSPKKKRAQPRRSWSPLRRSRKQLPNPPTPPHSSRGATATAAAAPAATSSSSTRTQPPPSIQPSGSGAEDSLSIQGSAHSSLMNSSLASSSQMTSSTAETTKRGGAGSWFKNRRRSLSPQKFMGRGRSLTTVREDKGAAAANHRQSSLPPPSAEQAELHKETQKLVRTLCKDDNRPLSPETVQDAYLAALDLKEQRQQQQQNPEELIQARQRIEQLQMELKAAQKAASQLASSNLVYEEQQKTLVEELEKARARVEALEKDQSTDSEALREQLQNAKRAMLQLQTENEELREKATKTAAASAEDDSYSNAAYDSIHDSFELQLKLQKELARVMARVHRLEEENAHYAEKQEKMQEILQQVADLEQDKEALEVENKSLKEQLAVSKQEAAKAARRSSSQKDVVLSSSQIATATTIIGRLTEECKTLTEREKELEAKLKRLETKNKNQKEIFTTALEIKQVEMKIYEQEARMNARKVEELNQTIADLHYHNSSIVVSASPAAPAEDPAVTQELRHHLREVEDRLELADAANQELEEKIESLNAELEERQLRVAQLEEQLVEEQKAAKKAMETETSALASKVSELSFLIQKKEDELMTINAELEDERKESEYRTQVRVNELTEQLNDYEMSLEEREQRIHELQAKVSEQEEEIARNKASPKSVMSYEDDDESSQRSARMDSIRRKMGTYEGLVRAKINRIQGIQNKQQEGNQQLERRSPTGRNLREASPPPTLVFATPVPNNRVVELEASLKASNEQIEELKFKLAETQLRLTQVQEASEHDPQSRFGELELSLRHGEDRIKDLEQQLHQAQHRLGEAQQARDKDREDYENQMKLLFAQREKDQARVLEMEQSVQQSDQEITRLRDVIQDMESKMEELQTEQMVIGRDESTCGSVRDQATMNALEEELEEVRQRYDDECDKFNSLSIQFEQLEKDRDGAHEKLRQAEFELLEKQNSMDELVAELDSTKAALADLEKRSLKRASGSEDRVVQLEAELKDAQEQLSEADMKIEMLEKFIEEETSGGITPSSDVRKMSSMQAEADIRRKDEEMHLLREEVERTRKELLRSRERVENLEMERNYSTAKLKELSSIVKNKSESEVEVQLYNKCIECAELSADKDDLSNKLRSNEAKVKRLEQEIAATQRMVTEISHSWDTAASADANVTRLKREHGESVTRATTLSIQLAESQMKIDELADKLASAERSNKAYAEELNGRPGIFQAMSMARSRSASRHCSPERRDEGLEVRKLKQRIALLEDQNAAYEASLTAYGSLHEKTRMSV